MRRELFDEEHDLFRASFRQFLEREVVPRNDEWELAGIVDRELFARAGAAGFLGMSAPEGLGGGGVDDFRYNQVIGEELQYSGVNAAGAGVVLINDVCLPYFLHIGNSEQQDRWVPGICSGDLITAIAMTEPGTGSDLAGIASTAVRDGGDYILNGAKTFISNGINADLVIVAAKTDIGARHRGISLFIVERGMRGFERGRNLQKMGLHAQDTAELSFSDVRVPAENLLGGEGDGFKSLVANLPRERLSIAISATAAAEAAFRETVAYCNERRAFGSTIGSFQNTRFRLAELVTEIQIAQTFVDRCVMASNDGSLTTEEASMAKWWCSELQGRAVDLGVQLHGGYGYMSEYPIARAYTDARITRIFGGTTEIMKEVICRSIGLDPARPAP